MLIDLLSDNNSISFNSYIASKIGLNAAIYLSELLKQYSFCRNNNYLNENYFTVDRVAIFNRTTLTEEQQLNIDVILMRLNLLLKRRSIQDPLSEDYFIHVDNILNLFASDDEKINKELKKITKAKAPTKLTQREQHKVTLKAGIKCTNEELLQAYRDWVDGVYENPHGFLSQKSIQIFQNTVDEFAKGDLDLALKIIDIATINGYRDAQWAINVFHKDYEKEFTKKSATKSTVRKADLSSEVF